MCCAVLHSQATWDGLPGAVSRVDVAPGSTVHAPQLRRERNDHWRRRAGRKRADVVEAALRQLVVPTLAEEFVGKPPLRLPASDESYSVLRQMVHPYAIQRQCLKSGTPLLAIAADARSADDVIALEGRLCCESHRPPTSLWKTSL